MAGTAFAALPPTSLPKEFFSPNPPPSHNLLSAGIHLGLLHVLFEETELATISHTVGEGSVNHQGDAAESIYWLCYTLTDTSKRGRVWLIASGEMDGPEHTVSVVNAKLDNSAQPTEDCPALPQKFAQLSFDGNITLGMKDEVAIDILGPTYKAQQDWVHYKYSGRIPGACSPEPADILNYLSFERSEGFVKWIVAGETTSC